MPITVATIQLAVALLLAAVVGVGAGIVSAVWPNSVFDALARVGSLFGLSMPVFWTGLVLIVVFALWLPWFPVGARDRSVTSSCPRSPSPSPRSR